ncbi:MAG: hypothetical protein ACP5N2_05350 [Candidatus Nanoarchaeia archaeon]
MGRQNLIKGRINKRAQTWSIDLVLGVVIFLLVVIVIYSLIASRPVQESQLRDDADKIYSRLDTRSDKNDQVPKIIEGNSISYEELENLYAEDYDTLKAKLGITTDFCIIVVTDNNGIINMTSGQSIGNGEDVILGNNIYCGN